MPCDQLLPQRLPLQVERLGVAPTHTLASTTQLAPVSHGCWDSAVVRLRPLQLLRGLALRNCGLRELMPPRGMQLLQYLDLSGNRLQALQVGWGSTCVFGVPAG